VLETQVDEERTRVRIGCPHVDRRQRVVEAAEQEIVDGCEEHQRVVSPRGRFGHEVEHLVAVGDRTADPVVQG
jgi:hypothetical protein